MSIKIINGDIKEGQPFFHNGSVLLMGTIGAGAEVNIENGGLRIIPPSENSVAIGDGAKIRIEGDSKNLDSPNINISSGNIIKNTIIGHQGDIIITSEEHNGKTDTIMQSKNGVTFDSAGDGISVNFTSSASIKPIEGGLDVQKGHIGRNVTIQSNSYKDINVRNVGEKFTLEGGYSNIHIEGNVNKNSHISGGDIVISGDVTDSKIESNGEYIQVDGYINGQSEAIIKSDFTDGTLDGEVCANYAQNGATIIAKSVNVKQWVGSSNNDHGITPENKTPEI